MTKVVHQDIAYWLTDEFMEQAVASGTGLVLVEYVNGEQKSRPISRDELRLLFKGRVSGLVKSEDKTVSVFCASHTPAARHAIVQEYLKSTLAGLKQIGQEFTARTGAQGKVRLPAEAKFVVAVHLEAHNGSPQLHVHVAVLDRVTPKGQTRTFATHTRELYKLRRLFAAAASHDFGHRLVSKLGVRVEKAQHGIRLPDVPKELCKRSSVRARQIDDFLATNKLKNSAITRDYAALVTRRQNASPEAGRQQFREDQVRSGFRGEQIHHRAKVDPATLHGRLTSRALTREAMTAARRLTKEQPSFTYHALLTRAFETAPAHRSPAGVELGASLVTKAPARYGLTPRTDEHGKSVYTSPAAQRHWKQIARKVEYVFASPKDTKQKPPSAQKSERVFANGERSNRPGESEQSARSQAERSGNKMGNEKGSGGAHGQEQSARPQPEGFTHGKSNEKGNDFNRVVERALLAHQVIGAVGRIGIQVAAKAIELYQEWAKPVWRVHGRGHKNSPGSVANMVRDLKPLSVMESHKAAIRAMCKLNGSLERKLNYAEHVYRMSRKPKYRIPKKCLIVVRDVGSANPKDVAFLLEKAERAKAKTLFVDRDASRSELLKAARSMKPGEHRHYSGPNSDMKR